MSPAGPKRTSQSSYVVAVSSSMCHALLDVPACYAGYRQPCIDQAPGANWWWWWWEGELCARTLQPRERVWAGVCLPPYCQVCHYHHIYQLRTLVEEMKFTHLKAGTVTLTFARCSFRYVHFEKPGADRGSAKQLSQIAKCTKISSIHAVDLQENLCYETTGQNCKELVLNQQQTEPISSSLLTCVT